MKHYPFVSTYRPDFEVVEERRGPVAFFPHTQQLPILLRALHMEFYGALPARVARVDHRAEGFDRLCLKAAAEVYCEIFNSAREDGLRLFPLMKPNLAATIAVVQQITESTPRGRVHRFRFYTGEDFFPEIYFIGKRVAFSEHLLERFTERVPNHVGTDLFVFLHLFFRNPGLVMRTGASLAVVQDYEKSILAFPFHENEGGELFFMTCLTVNEISSLEVQIPTEGFLPHYGPAYTRPRLRHWLPQLWANENMALWKRKAPIARLRPKPKITQKRNWHYAPHWARDDLKKRGHGPGSNLLFLDRIPGPITMELTPGKDEELHDQKELCKFGWPEYDWDKLLE